MEVIGCELLICHATAIMRGIKQLGSVTVLLTGNPCTGQDEPRPDFGLSGGDWVTFAVKSSESAS